MLNARGMSLIEALVALLVLSIGMLGVALMFVHNLRSSRTALLRTQAVNLVSDMADRIRANADARSAYDMARYGGSPAERGCGGNNCSASQLAEDDLARWQSAVRAALPAAPAGVRDADVEFVGGAPDLYRITVTWQEPGELHPFAHRTEILAQGGIVNAALERGLTLVELMVAMVIGCLIVVGALTIYAQGSATNRVNESVARLQEQGRYALSVIESDAQLAGFYGFTHLPETIRFIAGGNPDVVRATADQLRQSAAPLAGLPPGAHACGNNFAVDVMTPVQGSNGAFDLPCAAYRSGAQAGADTLTLRRAETKDAAPEAGRLQIFASRLASQTAHFLFVDGNAPAAVDADHRVLNWVVRSYYIARDSVSRADFPALRAKSLTRSGATLIFDEDEVMTGIEDLQVEFGIDTDGALRYVSPDFPDLPRCHVLAVRLWLRIRADEPEVGFSDERTYRYADVVYTPAGADRRYRRTLMSRTVAVRNARAA